MEGVRSSGQVVPLSARVEAFLSTFSRHFDELPLRLSALNNSLRALRTAEIQKGRVENIASEIDPLLTDEVRQDYRRQTLERIRGLRVCMRLWLTRARLIRSELQAAHREYHVYYDDIVRDNPDDEYMHSTGLDTWPDAFPVDAYIQQWDAQVACMIRAFQTTISSLNVVSTLPRQHIDLAQPQPVIVERAELEFTPIPEPDRNALADFKAEIKEAVERAEKSSFEPALRASKLLFLFVALTIILTICTLILFARQKNKGGKEDDSVHVSSMALILLVAIGAVGLGHWWWFVRRTDSFGSRPEMTLYLRGIAIDELLVTEFTQKCTSSNSILYALQETLANRGLEQINPIPFFQFAREHYPKLFLGSFVFEMKPEGILDIYFSSTMTMNQRQHVARSRPSRRRQLRLPETPVCQEFTLIADGFYDIDPWSLPEQFNFGPDEKFLDRMRQFRNEYKENHPDYVRELFDVTTVMNAIIARLERAHEALPDVEELLETFKAVCAQQDTAIEQLRQNNEVREEVNRVEEKKTEIGRSLVDAEALETARHFDKCSDIAAIIEHIRSLPFPMFDMGSEERFKYMPYYTKGIICILAGMIIVSGVTEKIVRWITKLLMLTVMNWTLFFLLIVWKSLVWLCRALLKFLLFAWTLIIWPLKWIFQKLK